VVWGPDDPSSRTGNLLAMGTHGRKNQACESCPALTSITEYRGSQEESGKHDRRNRSGSRDRVRSTPGHGADQNNGPSR